MQRSGGTSVCGPVPFSIFLSRHLHFICKCIYEVAHLLKILFFHPFIVGNIVCLFVCVHWNWGGCSLEPNQPVPRDAIFRWRFLLPRRNFGSIKSCANDLTPYITQTNPIIWLNATRSWYLGILRAVSFPKKVSTPHILSTFASLIAAVMAILHFSEVKPPKIKGLPTEIIRMLQDGSVCIYEPYPPRPPSEEIILSDVKLHICTWTLCVRAWSNGRAWSRIAGKVRCTFNLSSHQVQYESTVEAECVETASPLWPWTQHRHEKWRKRRQSSVRPCACALCLVISSLDHLCFNFLCSVVLLKTIIKTAINIFIHCLSNFPNHVSRWVKKYKKVKKISDRVVIVSHMLLNKT